MKNVLLIAPTGGNIKGVTGGITSWTQKFILNFHSTSFKIISIDSTPRNFILSNNINNISRIIRGLYGLLTIIFTTIKVIKENEFSIMHTTTSGHFGLVRDIILAKICQKNNIKCILHCRYGAIPNVLSSTLLHKKLLLYTLKQYDNIWILDKKTESALKEIKGFGNKVHLVPNCIEVPPIENFNATQYKSFAFIANLEPTKGLFELIDAVANTSKNIELVIVGGGNIIIEEKVKQMVNENPGKLKYLGKKTNDEAINILKQVDSLVLPTYYSSEAFPMSILEAMSLGKLVISTNHAAIPDMLTDLNGEKCGILVKKKSSSSLQEAIDFCYDNPEKANILCKEAYRKVLHAYDTNIIYMKIEKMYTDLIAPIK